MQKLGILECALSIAVWCGPSVAAAERQNQTLDDVRCAGTYRHHLQGICTDSRDAIFWSFTTTLVKTDRNGEVVAQVEVENHHGDLCFHDDRVYVAVNLGKFNDPAGNADSWVYVYDADDLSEVARHQTPQVFHGAGGIAYRQGRFFVVGGLPAGVEENYIYEYDEDLEFVEKHAIDSGQTHLGIQTAAFAAGHFWFGCYGNPKILLKVDSALETVERFEFDCSLGIESVGGGRFLIASGSCDKQTGCVGQARLAKPDANQGFVNIAAPR